MNDRVRLVEVGPRDGLQNESAEFDTATRVTLVRRLLDCGFDHVEAGSFVSPKWVPKMADTAEVLASFDEAERERLSVLAPNLRGFTDALAAGAREVAVFGAASEAFSRKNINCSIDESLDRFRPVCEAAAEHGIRVRGYVSCVLGCPYQGEVPPGEVARVTRELLDMGCYEVSLGDTIGVGTPRKARAMLDEVAATAPLEQLAVHYHDTYGQAVANIYASLDAGIRVVDSAVAGLGGCPYAPGAAGNVATEDVLYLLDGLGLRHGIDAEALMDTVRFILDALGKTPVSRVSAARLARRTA